MPQEPIQPNIPIGSEDRQRPTVPPPTVPSPTLSPPTLGSGSLIPSGLSRFRLTMLQAVRSDDDAWYRIVKSLGSGGSGSAFLVLCTGGKFIGNCFALKILRQADKPLRAVRFKEELRFLREQRDPGLAPIHDSGKFSWAGGEHPFFVTTYYPQTLRTAIDQGSIDFCTALLYIIQLLGTLRRLALLSPPVVHRDIKPGNIFVGGKVVILGDFGLLKRLEGTGTIDENDAEMMRESLEGAMPRAYRTPDLVRYARREAPLTVASDIYQVGLVAYEMLHDGFNPQKSSADKLAPVELVPLRRLRGAEGDRVSDILHGMLSDNPLSRPTAAFALQQLHVVLTEALRKRIESVGETL